MIITCTPRWRAFGTVAPAQPKHKHTIIIGYTRSRQTGSRGSFVKVVSFLLF